MRLIPSPSKPPFLRNRLANALLTTLSLSALATHSASVFAEDAIDRNPSYQGFFTADKPDLENTCILDLITSRPQAFYLDPKLPQPSTPSVFAKQNFANNENIFIQADLFEQPQAELYRFRGNTSFWQDGILVFSPFVEIDQAAQSAILSADTSEQTPLISNSSKPYRPVILHEKNLSIVAEQIKLDQNSRESDITQAKFQLFPSRTYGTAQWIKLSEQGNFANLRQAELSTCPSSEAYGEGDKDWHLEFDEVKIDRQAQRVIGKHTVLKIKDIPVFYSPYFDYPLNDRASGFLFPDFGRHSSLTSDAAIEFAKIPYFLNLAPNYDLTLTAMPMSQRGLLADGEFRYLSQQQQLNHRGTLQLSYLQDELTGTQGVSTIGQDGRLQYSDPTQDRWRVNLDTYQNWGDGFSSQLLWHDVSDASFYSDLPIDPRFQNATEIRQNALVRYQQTGLSAYAQMTGYKTLRTERNYYEIRPEVGVNWQALNQQNWQVDVALRTTDFIAQNEVNNSSLLRFEGLRTYLSPTVRYQQSNLYSDLKVETTLHHRAYQLDSTQDDSTLNANLTIPELKLYGALRFERQFANFWQTTDQTLSSDAAYYTQTLEPQVQYVYIPYKDQQQIPLFDSSSRSLDFSNLFASNRFYGVDRIGDTHQLSYALSSRIYSQNGQELVNLGIGQIAYFDDRKVTLGADALQTETFSDLYAKANFYLGKLSLENTLKIAYEDQKIDAASSRANLQLKKNQAAYVQYSRSLDPVNTSSLYNYENLAVGGYTPMTQNTQLGLYTRYDLLNNRAELNQLSLRYQSCCWSLQVAAEQTSFENGLSDNKIQFLFEFNGLSSQNSSNNLQKGIAERFYY